MVGSWLARLPGDVLNPEEGHDEHAKQEPPELAWEAPARPTKFSP